MSINLKILLKVFLVFLFSISNIYSQELKKVGKFKDWEAIVLFNQNGKVCFAQSKPVLQSPKKNDRDSRLFVSFRPEDKVLDEISTTSGYEFNSQNSILAVSGKKNISLI